jgi:two-component system nitrogen regulation response regulator GlnG
MKKVLIVDDDPLILFGLTRVLRDICDDVKYVAYGRLALKSVRDCFYDLCFLDINLPDGCGLDIMRTILEVSPDTKVIIMTAAHIDDEVTRKIAGKAYHFLPKPFNLEEVKSVVYRALESGGSACLL